MHGLTHGWCDHSHTCKIYKYFQGSFTMDDLYKKWTFINEHEHFVLILFQTETAIMCFKDLGE